jgi:hypothetical protein
MCQAIRDGGRRCPVHQHQNIAAIKAASHLSGLTRLQTERMFAELRREGRNAEPISNRLRAGSIRRIRNAVSGTNVEADVTAELERSAIHDQDIDPASAYANRALITRSRERAANLDQRFQEVANRTGLTKQEIAQKYKEFREAVDTSRGSDVPGEYDQNTRRAAVIANLPYDRASVVALVKIGNLTEAQNERRVTLIPAPEESHINAFGYDEGRLEIEFGSRLGEPYAYQNVPESLWEAIRDSDSPGRIFAREIRNNRDYQYASQAEAERDAVRVRCGACGQFRAASHTCPEREVRAELSNAPLTIEQVRDVLDSQQTDVPENESETVDAPLTEETPSLPENNEPVATETPEEASTPAPETFVVAAPDMPDLSNEAVAEEVPEQTTGYPNQVGTEEVPTIQVAERTALTQFRPETTDTSNLIVKEAADLAQRAIFIKSSQVDSHIWQLGGLSESDKNIIRNAPENMYFVVGKTTNLGSLGILSSYDNNLYTAESQVGWGLNGTASNNYSVGYRISRKGKNAPVQTFTAEEKTEAVEAENAVLTQLVEDGTAARIPAVSSETRRYTLDGNLKEQPFVRFGNAVALKRALRENKVAIVPVSIRTKDGTAANYVDDQGYNVYTRARNTVTGDVAIRRGENGAIEVVSSSRTLKCSCVDYRTKYHCKHVDYVHRHAGNIAQQIAPTAEAQASVASTPEGQHSNLLTAALSRRADISVQTNEDGSPYISFGDNVSAAGSPRTSYTYQYFNRFRIPERLRPADPQNITEEEALALYNYQQNINQLQSISTINSPAAIRTAVRRADVDVPVTANFYNYSGGRSQRADVTGTMRIGQQTGEIEDLQVRSHSLRCTCAEYAENYDCPHVRLMADQAFGVAGSGSQQSATTHTWSGAQIAYTEDMRGVAELQTHVARGHSIEEARQIIRNQREIREREERERQERRDRMLAEQAERDARYAREQAERLASQNAPVIRHTNSYRERMMRRWEEQEEGYTANPKQFFDDHKEALRRKRNGEDPIPFRTENVTDGICADEPGARQFGIELEFDIRSGVNRREAIEKIGRELHEAGLTDNPYQSGYHTARRNGWASWSLENDSTVDAELVSPLMKDTPEHWEQLRKVCEIINRNGGVASSRTGSHVHVSTASYGLSTAKHAELLRTVNNNEDVLYRMASNPARGTHRGTQWCAPNASDRAGDVDEEVMNGHNVLGGNSSHMVGLNFEGTANTDFKKSNVEFRMWDGSIDPAVIQQQVAMSAAITDYAERKVVKDKISRSGAATDRVRIGSGKRKEQAALTSAGTQTHTEETFKESTEQAAQFFDKIFRRREDRAAAASLFAVTNWNS